MADDFRIRNARLAKPHSYKVGDSVLLSTKHVNLNLPCKKLSPAFVGPFCIRALLGTNAVQLHYSERFQLLNPTVNIAQYTSAYGAEHGWKIRRSSWFLFKDSFKDPRYCSLGFLGASGGVREGIRTTMWGQGEEWVS
eukprot:01594_6